MNRKLWKYAIIGMLLFDLCLIAVRTDALFNQGNSAAPLAQSLLQTDIQDNSRNQLPARTKTAEKMTVATIFLLTAITLM
jgi:hypothetical protein